MTHTDYEEKYRNIQRNIPELQKVYAEKYVKEMPKETIESYKKTCTDMGFILNVDQGTISYSETFEPLKINYEVCYVRHGRTYGNVEPRVFQGFTDYNENQLDDYGKDQAISAASKLKEIKSTWKPDVIIVSPLYRAIETADAYIALNPDIPFYIVGEAHEMCFGVYDNQKLMNVSADDIIHLFYTKQNVLVQAQKPHIVKKGWMTKFKKEGDILESETFIDVIVRMKKMLHSIETSIIKTVQINEDRKAKVVIYGHSMVGAAVAMLLGHGKYKATDKILGFDGKEFIMPHTTPILLPPKIPSPSVSIC